MDYDHIDELERRVGAIEERLAAYGPIERHEDPLDMVGLVHRVLTPITHGTPSEEPSIFEAAESADVSDAATRLAKRALARSQGVYTKDELKSLTERIKVDLGLAPVPQQEEESSDVCVWRFTDYDTWRTTCNGLVKSCIADVLRFKYCPYCGKERKGD